jgi:predicted GNAT family acetyltransferase
MAELVDNAARGRLEMSVEGLVVFADYRRQGDRLVIDHVEAPVPLRGTGAAGRFMTALVGHARSNGLKLVPVCGYAAAWLARHPAEAAGLVA